MHLGKKKTPLFGRKCESNKTGPKASSCKFNISNLHKAVISRTKSTEALKYRITHLSLNQNSSLHKLFDAGKISLNELDV